MNIQLADVITIGDEILYGQIVDTNSAWLGTELTKIGLKVRQITSISDNPEHIIQTLNQVKKEVAVIIITGGLGPTKDDLTKQTLCRYFNTELVLHEPSLLHIAHLFKRYDREVTELNRQQAMLPATCTPIENSLGTAPGMWFEEEEVIYISLPGVPFEMKRIMADTVLPQLKEKFKGQQIQHQVIQTIGLGESFLADKIAAWEDNLPGNLKLAYLPNLSGVRLRITGFSNEQNNLKAKLNLEEQLNTETKKLQEFIPEYIFALGEIPIEAAMGNLLKEKGLTISTAESCTGGHLAHKLTSIAGSSEYFMGSILAYHNNVKINQLGITPDDLSQHGAVSEVVVSQMAANIRKLLNTDIGLATSGIAGPGGGTPDKPVGTIWIAYADAEKIVARQLSFNKDRLLNIEYTTYAILNLLRQQLNQA